MSEELTPKQRATAYQHWCSMITRECRDLAGLDRIGTRALQDRDVRADAQLRSMIQGELERRRVELNREEQRQRESETASRPPPKHRSSASRRDTFGRGSVPGFDSEFRSPSRPVSPAPAPPPDPDGEALDGLVAELGRALKAEDEDGAQAVCTRLRALHEHRSKILSADNLGQYEQRVEKLRTRLSGFRSQIAVMAHDACAAARLGDATVTAKLVSRLSAIHVAHPRLLDEPGLDRIRQNIVAANEGHEDSLTTHRLIERQRAVVVKLKRLWAAVNEFHCVVSTTSETSDEFRCAENKYLQVLQEIRLYEDDWLAEFVLEVADVLAEWSVPPPGAKKQIDRFLEKVHAGIERIQRRMGEIEDELDDRREG